MKKKEIVNYLIFGVLTTFVSIVTYIIFTKTFLNPNNPILLQIANILSWVCAVLFAYFTNKKYVFESNNNNVIKEMFNFFASRIATLLTEMLLMFLLVTLLNIDDIISKIIVQIIVIILNYVLSKLFVFKKNNINTIVFDMDGLMFDTEPLYINSAKEIAKKWNVFIPDEVIVSAVGTNQETTKKLYLSYLGEDFNFDKFKKEYNDYMDEQIKKDGIKIKEGLVELLDYLKNNNYKVALASSSKIERILWYLEITNIDKKIFGSILCGEDISEGKPNPEIFLKAIKNLESKPQNTIILEDSKNGIIAAKKSKATAVMIPDLIKPDNLPYDMKFKTLKEFNDYLKMQM